MPSRNQELKWSSHILAVLLAVQCSLALADDWGSIRGQIVVEGEIPERLLLIAKGSNVKDKEICAAEDHYAEDLIIDKESKGLANVFVYLVKKPKSIHPDLIEPSMEAVSVNFKGCQLVPHCLVASIGQPIQVGNEDRIAHNLHHHAMKTAPLSGLNAPMEKDSAPLLFRKAEAWPFKLTCDFHPWTSGYWLIVDHPYAALTDKDGRFSIDNLPVGDHQFTIWHERVGYVERKFKVTVAAGDPVELPIMKLDITRFQKPSESK